MGNNDSGQLGHMVVGEFVAHDALKLNADGHGHRSAAHVKKCVVCGNPCTGEKRIRGVMVCEVRSPTKIPTRMKTFLLYSAATLLAGLLAYGAETAPAPSPACTFMSNTTLGSAKGPQWIRCTSETMRTDARCRMLCEAAAKR